jgi:hypothetical protein
MTRRLLNALVTRRQIRGAEPRARQCPRSVAMKLAGHKTDAVYRRYAIVSEADLREGHRQARGHERKRAVTGTMDPRRRQRAEFGGGRGIRTPKGREARWISRARSLAF